MTIKYGYKRLVLWRLLARDIVTFFVICFALLQPLYAEKQGDQRNFSWFSQFSILPSTLILGAAFEQHQFGIAAGRSKTVPYSSLGLDYSYYISAAARGPYAKVFFERRWYDPDLTVYSDGGATQILDHHCADFIGAMAGYQWPIFAANTYFQAAFGWQYNDNPVDIGMTAVGLDQSTKSWSEATGEVGIGAYFD